MEKKLSDSINDAENKWFDKSIHFVKDHFDKLFLPSHDVSHHIRTWNHAKSILTAFDEITNNIDYSIVEAILLASMFHDTGMTVTRGAKHGSFSKNIYNEFISLQDKDRPALHKQIAEAIELHDQKERYIYHPFIIDESPDILTITSIADDLDALGTIGIYRYAEIYLHRETSFKSLGVQVLENVSVRFNHFIKATTLLPSIVKQTKESYREIINFFDYYNQQILLETEPMTVYNGHIGVINYIRRFCIKEKIKPENLTDILSENNTGTYVYNYFIDLKNAINQTNISL